jgi:hypothetical protein
VQSGEKSHMIHFSFSLSQLSKKSLQASLKKAVFLNCMFPKSILNQGLTANLR